MIIFRPSIGNGVSVVSVDAKGNWYGKSLGGNIIKEVSTPTIPFIKVDSKLFSTSDLSPGQQASTWFYKPLTDFDFINGNSIYRCVYIGAEADVSGDENFSEVIGTLISTVTHTSPITYPSTQTLAQANATLDNTVSVEMWFEGVYNLLSSVNSLSISDEFDSTSKLNDAVEASNVNWQAAVGLDLTIIPGQYIKLWLKITPTQDRNLLDYGGFTFTYSVGDLVIQNIERVTGRLNVAKVYAGPLNDSNNNILINQLLPPQFEYNSIIKIIEKNDFSNIFYIDTSNNMKDLIVKSDLDVNSNKYINYDFSTITGNISGSNQYTFARVIECINNGNTQNLNIVDNSLRQFLNAKTVIDIFISKSDRYDAFIFFNELISDNNTDYTDKYEHKLYNWNFGVIRLDLSFSTPAQFETIEIGLENTFNLKILDASTVYILKPNHFATSIIQQDDLYTSIGFDIEDCRINDKKSFITYIWEKDIVRPTIETIDGIDIQFVKTYNSLLPKDVNNQVTTIKNNANNDAYLSFDDISKVDTINVSDLRSVEYLNDGTPYLKTGSCHEKAINIGTSPVSYDIVSEVDEFSSTFGVSFDKSSLVTTTGITGFDTVLYDIEYPSHNHLLNQEDFDNYNTTKLIYDNVTKTYYEQVSTRNDGILTTIIESSQTLVPITGSSTETLSIYLNKILPTDDISSLTTEFAHIVKISGDGNTALIIAKNVISVDGSNNPLYDFESSRAYIYKRCTGTWKKIIEITPKLENPSTFGHFFSILDSDKVDISSNGNSVVISAVASTEYVPNLGKQYTYNGYSVYYFTTSTDWISYTQTRIDTPVAMNVDQRSFLENDLSFGYSVAVSDDGNKIVIGSPSEFFNYIQTDSQGAILNDYQVLDSGAIYIFTKNPVSPAGPAASGQNLVYGTQISGAGIDVPLYFLQRIIPPDASDITVNGIIPICTTNGIYQGKRFGEKVKCDINGNIIAVGAKNDSSQGLYAGAVYTILTPIDSCVLDAQNKFIKVLPSDGYKNQQFSSYSIDLSEDGGTLIVGDGNYNNGEGRAHIFDLDWFNKFTSPYVEVVLPAGGFDDTTLNSIIRRYGQIVNISNDGSIAYVKDTYSIRGYSSTGIRGNTARNFSYDRKLIEFDKILDLSAITTSSGESFDMNDNGNVIIVGFEKINSNTVDRVFIQDYVPANYISHTSSACTTALSAGESTPVPYLIDIEQVPHNYIEKEIIGEISPMVLIGNEVPGFVYANEFKNIFTVHCNGNNNIVALTVSYNFFTLQWQFEYLNNQGQSVTSTISPNVKLTPYFPNAITINTFRKQVNGYYCGKRYMLTYDLFVNGKFLYSGITYTFDTTNSYVITTNPNADFSGSLTYWDVREILLQPLQYNKTMFGVISNKIWAELEPEILNNTDNTEGFETFIYRRKILFHNLPWDGNDDMIVPIVLQGNGYSVGSQYSENITRSQFDFSNIDISNISFGFTYEGNNEVLKYKAWKYDYNKDQMVVWVRLENWKGQRLIMYYGDTKLTQPPIINNLYTGFYGIWLMDDFVTISRLRYTDISIFDGGEALVLGRNGNYYLNQINKQYLFGNQSLYKSNKFDIYYDDIEVDIDREETVTNFISTNVKLFAPGFMEIRKVSSSDPADIESDQAST